LRNRKQALMHTGAVRRS